MNDGEIVPVGTVDIYDEPIQPLLPPSLKVDVTSGTMIEDYLGEFNGKRFEAVDGGILNEPVWSRHSSREDLRIALFQKKELKWLIPNFRGFTMRLLLTRELDVVDEDSTRRPLLVKSLLTLNRISITVSMKQKKDC